MNRLSEFSSQTALGAMQTMVVIGGTLSTAAMLKVSGYPEGRFLWPKDSVFVREFGFLLLLIPALWVVVSVILEQRYPGWFSKRWTVGSGLVVLLALGLYFLFTALAAAGGGTIIQAVD